MGILVSFVFDRSQSQYNGRWFNCCNSIVDSDSRKVVIYIFFLIYYECSFIIAFAVIYTQPKTARISSLPAGNGVSIPVAIQNASTLVTDNTLITQVTAAVNAQIEVDVWPLWGVSMVLTFYPDPRLIPVDSWLLLLEDHSDVSGATGYHTIGSNGLPLAKVFIQDAINAGINWSIVFSHEILEMMIDPWTFSSVFVPTSVRLKSLFLLNLPPIVECCCRCCFRDM
jgi:hypothetical protein